MTCEIIAHASIRYSAKYHVRVGGRVYEASVHDPPGEDCTVHIVGLEQGSDLHSSIKSAVLRDWLGSDIPVR